MGPFLPAATAIIPKFFLPNESGPESSERTQRVWQVEWRESNGGSKKTHLLIGCRGHFWFRSSGTMNDWMDRTCLRSSYARTIVAGSVLDTICYTHAQSRLMRLNRQVPVWKAYDEAFSFEWILEKMLVCFTCDYGERRGGTRYHERLINWQSDKYQSQVGGNALNYINKNPKATLS